MRSQPNCVEVVVVIFVVVIVVVVAVVFLRVPDFRTLPSWSV